MAGSGITALRPRIAVAELRIVPGEARTGRAAKNARMATGQATRTGIATRTKPS